MDDGWATDGRYKFRHAGTSDWTCMLGLERGKTAIQAPFTILTRRVPIDGPCGNIFTGKFFDRWVGFSLDRDRHIQSFEVLTAIQEGRRGVPLQCSGLTDDRSTDSLSRRAGVQKP